MTTAHIALGSNLGDRAALLCGALAALQRGGEVRVVAESAVYETAPVGGPPQPDYLNMVVAVETSLGPEALLERCLAVEAAHGRVRRERWGARNLDLDLLSHGTVTLETERLTLPHPRLAERAFVLVPLAEIAPELKIGDATAGALAARCDRSGLRRIGRLDDVVTDRRAVRERGGPILPYGRTPYLRNRPWR